MAANDSEGMAHSVLLVIRRLQAACGRDELREALRYAKDVYGLSSQPDNDGDDPDASGQLDERNKTAGLLVSFLPPMGDFPEALLRLVYDKDDIQSTSDLLNLADGFFLDVHPIFSIGSLVSSLSRSHRGNVAERHIWRLLKVVLLDRSHTPMLWDEVMWKKVFPKKEWEDVCLSIVSWLIIIIEARSVWKTSDLSSECFLPRVLSLLLDGLLFNNDASVEKMAVLFGVFLRRFINRGSGDVLVDVLVSQCRVQFARSEKFGSLLLVLRHIRDLHALEKFFECLLSYRDSTEAVSFLNALYLKAVGNSLRDDMAYVLFQRILLKRQLPKRKAECLIDLLLKSEEKSEEVVRQLAKTWSDKEAIDHMSLPNQAYRTYLLTLSIPHLNVGGDDRITRWLLDGVTNRLENPLETIRFQGMRVAHTIAAQQPNADPLFHDIDTEFQTLKAEEQWEHADDAVVSVGVSNETLEQNQQTADSDDDSNASSIEEYDLEPLVEEDTSEKVITKGHRPMTLTDLYHDLQDTEEPMKIIVALKRLPLLLKEHPSELPSMAAALSRTLVHVALPDWISEEMLKDDAGEMKGLPSSTAVRVHCLSLLLIEAPLHCGGHVAAMVASKQLAEYQRLENLEALRQAAIQLSRPPQSLSSPQTSESLASGVLQLHDAKTRTWGVRSLEKYRKTTTTWKNRFVDIVGLWLSSLLLACQSRQQGFDIMERNPVVLGGVLITLGTFAECATNSIASMSIALTSFPLIRAALEQKVSKVHVRRCGFRSLASLIGSIPIGRLSAAVGNPLLTKTDSTDEALRDMIVWIKNQTEKTVAGDPDERCRGLAAHTLHLCSQISQSAVENSSPSMSLLPKPQSIEFRIPSVMDSNLLK